MPLQGWETTAGFWEKNHRFGLEHDVAGGPVGLWLLLDQLLEGSTDLPIEPSSTMPEHSILDLCDGTTLSSGLVFHNTLHLSFALAKLICSLAPTALPVFKLLPPSTWNALFCVQIIPTFPGQKQAGAPGCLTPKQHLVYPLQCGP